MPKERRLEDFITMPAGQEEAENLEARILKEAEEFYNEHFGPMHEAEPLDASILNKGREQLKSK